MLLLKHPDWGLGQAPVASAGVVAARREEGRSGKWVKPVARASGSFDQSAGGTGMAVIGPLKGNRVTKKVVMDIETILDAEAAARARFEPDEAFAPFPLHALACVSLLVIDHDAMARPVYEIHSFSREQLSERAILASVERVLSGSFEVITFNGRGFDVPVLMTRTALTGEYAPTIARLHMQNRHTAGRHVDLLDVVSGYGAAPKPRLSQLCSAFSIPCKLEGGDADVASLVAAGDWRKLTAYCETDVVATFLASQIWRGAERGAAEFAIESWTRLAHWIRANQPRLQHLLAYAEPPPMLAGGSAMGEIDYRELGW